jgi:hypothetical protein
MRFGLHDAAGGGFFLRVRYAHSPAANWCVLRMQIGEGTAGDSLNVPFRSAQFRSVGTQNLVSASACTQHDVMYSVYIDQYVMGSSTSITSSVITDETPDANLPLPFLYFWGGGA